MDTRKRWSARRRIGVTLLGLLALSVVVVGYLAVVPPNLGAIVSRPHPAADYAEAVQRVTAIQAQEAVGYNPLCHTQLLTHDHKTARAIAFVHGYTNCPHMYLELGQQFYDLGYNVLLVPMPHHGLADIMTTELSKLTAEEMAAYSDQLVDISRGLADHVTIVGLSGGGVVAGWAAQTRADLDQAVLIAPAFGLKQIPGPVTVLADNVVLLLPDWYRWWDPLHNDKSPAPTLSPNGVQGYPRYSVHGLAQQLRLGFATRALARRTAPAARRIVVVTNANDSAVDNAAAAQVAADWSAHGGAVTRYEFPDDLHLVHNLVDPGETGQRVELVYPKLIELIGR
jgi:pimeloyl-ACP methyl ester carboxylesterase